MADWSYAPRAENDAKHEENAMRMWMKSLCLLVVLSLAAAGVASAGCGVKDTHEGTLKAVEAAESVVVVVGEDGEEVKLQLTEKTKVLDADGNEMPAAELVGKKVQVVSEHAKIDSIKEIA